jgi:hypothetical protein
MAVPTLVSVGTAVTAAQYSTPNVTVPLPSGIVVNDLLIMLVSAPGYLSAGTPTGWTPFSFNSNNIIGFYKLATGSDTAPSLKVPGVGCLAQIAAFRGVSTSAPFDVIGTITNTGTPTNNNIPSITTVTAQDLVLLLSSVNVDDRSSASPTYNSTRLNTPTGQTFTLVMNSFYDGVALDFQGIAGGIWSFPKSTAGATGIAAISQTETANSGGTQWATSGILIALKPGISVVTQSKTSSVLAQIAARTPKTTTVSAQTGIRRPKTTSLATLINTARSNVWLPMSGGYLNSWNDAGYPYGSGSYYRDEQGLVHLRGSITGGTNGQTAFVLPPGYCPLQTAEYVVTSTSGSFCTIQVRADGSVVPTNGAHPISLDTIYFDALPPIPTVTPKFVNALALIQGTQTPYALATAFIRGTQTPYVLGSAFIKGTQARATNALALIQGTQQAATSVFTLVQVTVPQYVAALTLIKGTQTPYTRGLALVQGTQTKSTSALALVQGTQKASTNALALIQVTVPQFVAAIAQVAATQPKTTTALALIINRVLQSTIVGIGILASNANVWTPVTGHYQNGWQDAPFPYQGVSYWKDSLGWVHIRGAASGGVLGTAFILPVGYRPNAIVDYVATSGNSVAGGWCRIYPDGSVVVEGGSNSPFDFNTFYFDANPPTTVSKSTTATAIVQATLPKAVTTSAVISGTTLQTSNVSALIKGIGLKSTNVTAVIQATVKDTASVSALVGGTIPHTSTIQALIQYTASKVSTVTALIGGGFSWGTSFVDVPGSTISINASGAKKIRIDSSLSVQMMSAANTFTVRLMQDGVAVGTAYVSKIDAVNNHYGFSYRWIISAPTAGLHQYKLQIAVADSSSTLVADSHDYINIMGVEC